MANLNVDYSKGLFADTNTILTDVERSQLSNLRNITQNFSVVVPLDKIVLLDAVKLNNVPDSVLVNGPLDLLNSYRDLDTSSYKLACLAGQSIVQSVVNNTNMNYTVFNTSTALDSYSQIIKDMCTTLVTNLRPDFIVDPAIMANIANSLTESMVKNVTVVNPYNAQGVVTLQDYVKACVSNTKMFIANNLGHYDTVKRRQLLTVYVVAFYPLFVAKYVASYIRTSGENETSGKPPSFIVRQFAILTLKVLLVQIILLMIQQCPTTTIRTSLKSAIRTLLYSIASEYNTQEDFSKYYNEIMTLAAKNKSTREAIKTLSKDMEAAKGNVEKAVVNDQIASKQVKYTRLLMSIWLTILCILIVACIVFLIIGTAENNMFYYMYVLCGIFVVSVFVNGLVHVVRST